MFISLCCRGFSFCIRFLYGTILFKGSRLFLVNVKSPGGGELSLSACPGVGNRTSIEEKIPNSRGCAWRGGGGW